MSKPPQVILYSNTVHAWEVWQAGRPLAKSRSRGVLTDRFPEAIPPTEDQLRLEREDGEKR